MIVADQELFQATFSSSSRELSCKDGGLNNQCNRGIDNLDICCHNLYLELNKRMKIIKRPQNYSIFGGKCQLRQGNHKCLF